MAYANFEQYRDAVVEALKPELQANDYQYDDDLLTQKVSEAMDELRMHRRYPSTYSDARILADMERYIAKVKYVAFIKYGKIGTYGELYHYENTVHRSWAHEYEMWYGVLPISQVCN